MKPKTLGEITAIGVVDATLADARQERTETLDVGNVPSPPRSKFRFAPACLTLFYGKFGDDARGRLRKQLSTKGREPVLIEIKVNCSTVFSSDLKLADLPAAGLLRSNNMSNPVENLLISYYREQLINEGRSERELSLMDWHNQSYIAARPDLIAGLRDTPDFGHLKALSWLADWQNERCGFVTVLDRAAITKTRVIGHWSKCEVNPVF